MKLVLSCEHATNFIPADYQYLFQGNEEVLNSHEGFDPGTFDLFLFLKPLAYFAEFQTIGRLLIETNRSIGNKALFSRFTSELNEKSKQELLQKYYLKYRNTIEQQIQNIDKTEETTLHISLHSFTPVLKGITRNADIGLLYDPGKKEEKELCRYAKHLLSKELPEMNIRFNYPYLGKADGYTTYLRKKIPENYIGIELEVNQKWVANNSMNLEIKEALYSVILKLK